MPTYGLNAEGFTSKTLSVIREDLNTVLRAAFGASVRLDDKSIFGQIVGILAERYALLWELAEQVNSTQDPDKATGAALEAICALTGTFRPAATYSAVTLTLTGTGATLVPANSQVRTASTEQLFATTADATITAVAAWAATTGYALGARVTNVGNVYQCTVAGVSGATGPTGTATSIPGDGTVTWTYVGVGTAAVDAAAKATVTGPVAAYARDINTIVNAVVGWDSVVNLLDANIGRNIGTDSELRLLREQELATGGSTPIDALRAELLAIPDVVAATVFCNNTDTTDADGLPPHSIEALVRGPDAPTAEFDQRVFDALLAGVAAGIATYAGGAGGSAVVGTSTDAQGTVHTVRFTRPAAVPIYVAITIVKDPGEYPVDGDEEVKKAIVTWGDLQNTGKNAVSSRIAAAAFDVPGVLDVTACLISTAPGPTLPTTIAISLRELATYDTSRITVTSSDGVP